MELIKKQIGIFILLLVLGSVSAQTPTIANQWTFGGDQTEFGARTLALNDGDLLMLVMSESDVSGNITQSHFGGGDYWVVKLNDNGSIIWQKRLGGSSIDDPADAVELPNGDIVVLGRSNSGVSGNKTAVSYGSNDYWVCKLNSNGELLWDKSFGGNELDVGTSITVLSNGNLLLGGYSSSGATGVKTSANKGVSDFWVIEIDTSGSIVNQQSIGGSDYEYLRDIEIDALGNIWLLGSTQSSNTGDKLSQSYGSMDAWLVKLDQSLNVLQEKSYGGSGADYGRKLIRNNSNFWIAGRSWSSPSGSKTSQSYGVSDYWMINVGLDLVQLSDYSFGGSSLDDLNAAVQLQPNLFLLSGGSQSLVSGTKTVPLFGDTLFTKNDAWLVGVDSSGNQVFDLALGGNGVEMAFDVVQVLQNNKVYCVSNSNTDVDGNKTVPAIGLPYQDVWLVELDFTVSVSEVNTSNNNLKAFPNPAQTLLNFSLPLKATEAEVMLVDLKGSVVYQNKVFGVAKSSINVSGLPKGVYMLQVKSTSYTYNRKVVIE